MHRHGKPEGANKERTREPAGDTLQSRWTSWPQQRPRLPRTACGPGPKGAETLALGPPPATPRLSPCAGSILAATCSRW